MVASLNSFVDLRAPGAPGPPPGAMPGVWDDGSHLDLVASGVERPHGVQIRAGGPGDSPPDAGSPRVSPGRGRSRRHHGRGGRTAAGPLRPPGAEGLEPFRILRFDDPDGLGDPEDFAA